MDEKDTNSGIIRDLNEMPTPETGFQGQLKCSTDEAEVGDTVEITGLDLPEEGEFQLLWRSYSVDWDMERRSDGIIWRRFFGFAHREVQRSLAEVRTDPNGRFSREFAVPEDFGGLHDIYLIDETRRINKVGLRIAPSFDVTPDSVPLGQPITITAKGLPLPVADSVDNPPYHVYYDNKYTGLISPVTPDGTTSFTIPATGEKGTHVIDVERCPFGNAHSYRQTHIGLISLPGTPDLSWTFELTGGEPNLPPPIEEQTPAPVMRQGEEAPAEKNPSLWTEERAIPVTGTVNLSGVGFPQDADVKIAWSQLEGSNLREERFSEREAVVVWAEADGEGRFSAQMAPMPATVQGGPHPISAYVEGEKVATASVIVLPQFKELDPDSGPPGTQITVNGEGVGWNEMWNQVTILYDNSYIGYVCGGDIPGVVEGKLRATGQPGWHIIDLYPTIQKQRNFADEAFEIPFIYRLPFLNWDSHPQGYHFRYAFRVEE